MLVRNIADAEEKEIKMDGVKNVTKKIPIGASDGSPTMSFRVFTLEPGGHTPYHNHEQEHINYIIEGEGVIIDAEGNERPLKKGDFVLVFPNEKHQYKNKSENNFVMICAVRKEYE